VINLNDITFNKQLGNLIDRSFEMPYVSYCQTLATIARKKLKYSVDNYGEKIKNDDLEHITTWPTDSDSVDNYGWL